MSVLGWLTGSDDAAQAQRDAANQMAQTQLQMYNQTRADNEPYRQAGYKYLGQLDNQMGDLNRSFTMADFQSDPGYQFRMQQGQKAIEASASARGLVGSGKTLKALSDYGQGMGAQEFQSAYDRFTNDRNQRFGKLSTMAGFGQSANQMNAGAGMNYANQVNQAQSAIGNANAAQATGDWNTVMNLGNMGLQGYLGYAALNKK